MNNTKHTPGPWRIDRDGDIVGFHGYTLPLYGIYSPPAGHHNAMKEAQANMALVAAAPELLEALQLARAGLDAHLSYARGKEDYNMFHAAVFSIEKIDRVIAKALGNDEN